MKKKYLSGVFLLAATMMFPSLLFAAASEVSAAPVRQGRTAPEHNGHAGHGDHSGKPVTWTRFPTLKTRMSGENRESMLVVPQNIVADSINAWSSNLNDEHARRSLPMEMSGARLDKPANGGFQMLTARQEQAGQVQVASTVYYFGERGAKNPTAMFMQQKNELEIIPQPFPREHSRYRANEDWKFLVRFNGKPVPGQKVSLETQNGSNALLLSDRQGVITLHVPDDFKPVEEGAAGQDHGMRRGAEFVLATEHAEAGKTYQTGFNSSYGPDAFDQRSLAMGLGFTLLGMLGAVPLLRQRKAGKKVMADSAAEASTSKSGEV